VDISVIIPTFNRQDFILRAVSSVLAQKGVNFELIVVDDGSSDKTREFLLPFMDRITYIYQENSGVSAARNTGIRQAKGDLIAFLDSDDEYLPGKLSAQIDFMRLNSMLLFSQCQERWIRKGMRVNPGKKHQKRAGLIFSESLRLCLISPSAVILKRRFFEEIGLFDETLLACEDYDLWLRALWKYPVGLLNKELVVRHGGRADQLSARHSLDKYRIRTLEKLLCEPNLPQDFRLETERVMAEKKEIFEKGMFKRAGS
jgi:glycosyltransferase involved in cell wall biosynthesis